MKRNRVKDCLDDEPSPEGDEWIEWCGSPMWVAGWTSGGAPYGLTVDEWRSAMRNSEPNAGWARARWVFEELFGRRCGADVTVEVGRVMRLGHGMARDGFVAWIALEPDPDGLTGEYVALLPRSRTAVAHRVRACLRPDPLGRPVSARELDHAILDRNRRSAGALAHCIPTSSGRCVFNADLPQMRLGPPTKTTPPHAEHQPSPASAVTVCSPAAPCSAARCA